MDKYVRMIINYLVEIMQLFFITIIVKSCPFVGQLITLLIETRELYSRLMRQVFEDFFLFIPFGGVHGVLLSFGVTF